MSKQIRSGLQCVGVFSSKKKLGYYYGNLKRIIN